MTSLIWREQAIDPPSVHASPAVSMVRTTPKLEMLRRQDAVPDLDLGPISHDNRALHEARGGRGGVPDSRVQSEVAVGVCQLSTEPVVP